MKQSSHMNRMLPEKALLIHEDGLVAFRVSEFGGHPVPEEGLTLEIPGGGLLTVWPDGEYTCQDVDRPDESLVNTYFSYVVETSDGSSLVGSFSLSEGSGVPVGMQDFQAWSLPELLDVAVECLLSGAGTGMLEYSVHGAPGAAVHVEGVELTGLDAGFDDLTRLILDSQNS
jgi:hypothetical protein